jgi:hypothetical protein
VKSNNSWRRSTKTAAEDSAGHPSPRPHAFKASPYGSTPWKTSTHLPAHHRRIPELPRNRRRRLRPDHRRNPVSGRSHRPGKQRTQRRPSTLGQPGSPPRRVQRLRQAGTIPRPLAVRTMRRCVKNAPGLMATGRLGCSEAVGRGGVEPPTFRFSGVTYSLLAVLPPRSEGGRRVPK